MKREGKRRIFREKNWHSELKVVVYFFTLNHIDNFALYRVINACPMTRLSLSHQVAVQYTKLCTLCTVYCVAVCTKSLTLPYFWYLSLCLIRLPTSFTLSLRNAHVLVLCDCFCLKKKAITSWLMLIKWFKFNWPDTR